MTAPLTFVASDAFLDSLANRLNSEGVVCVENAIAAESLTRWRAQLSDYLSKHGRRYFSIIQPWQVQDSAYAELSNDQNFRTLLCGLTRRGIPGRLVDEDIYNVLRVIAGPNGKRQSLMFHYDASIITVLIPLEIPDGKPEEAGDLIAYPNRRPVRRLALVNAVEKIMVQNPVSRAIFSRRVRQRQTDSNIFRLTPGNIYLFWGYRTLHANLGCKSNSLRATLLFHHGDPHRGSIITRAIRWTRRVRELGNLPQAG